MPRFTSPSRFVALTALVALASGTSATAQDADAVVKAANANIKAIRTTLADGKETKDGKEKLFPQTKRLRIEKFVVEDKQVRVVGVYLDPGVWPPVVGGVDAVESPTFVAVRTEAERIVRAQSNAKVDEPQFDWGGVTRIGAVTSKGTVQNPKNPRLPYLIVQDAANRAGGETNPTRWRPAADRLVVTGARFEANGDLVLSALVGAGDTAAETWLTTEGPAVLKEHAANWLAEQAKGDPKEAPKEHPVLTFEGKPVAIKWERAEGGANLVWTAAAKNIQEVLATAKPVGPLKPEEALALRRLFVSRTYCAAPAKPDKALGWDRLEFRVEGFRSGSTALFNLPKEEQPQIIVKVSGQITPVWEKMVKGTVAEQFQVDLGDLLDALPEPVGELQLAVSANRALDGVRVDPGFTFDADGKLQLAGLHPELDADALNELTAVVRRAIATHGNAKDPADPVGQKYKVLSCQPVSAAGMESLPIRKVRDELHAWAMRTKDDVRLRRLYFVTDPKALEPQHYAVAKDGAGLVLLYQTASAPDLKAVEAEFARIFRAHFPKGLPGPKMAVAPAAPAVPAPPAPPPEGKGAAAEKEPLLPGLTAEIRKIVAADQKTWYGVLIERGYFDDKDRYTLAGVVDKADQNVALGKLLYQLKNDLKWKGYFRDQDGAEQDVEVPALKPISMDEMIARVKRVTPAYPEFDGVRVESAYYDKDVKLIFRVQAVGMITPAVAGKLAQLLVNDPKYGRRVVKPEQPPEPAPRLPPKLGVTRTTGAAYPGEWIDNFSLGFGAQLLADGEKKKAREWLEVGLLHYPNVSGVWFLSAYFNHLEGDTELVERDLKRVIDLETLSFDGDAQRKRRYAEAKDLQGPKRAALENLWLVRYRDVKKGVEPLTLGGK